MDSEFIRERITKLRMDKNISEREMSLSLGKAHNYIHSITSGKMLPNMESFLDICDYFDITPLDFFDTEIENPSLNKKISNELKRLSSNNMEVFLDILKITEPLYFQSYLKFMDTFRKSI